jgi:hypothetical protein
MIISIMFSAKDKEKTLDKVEEMIYTNKATQKNHEN